MHYPHGENEIHLKGSSDVDNADLSLFEEEITNNYLQKAPRASYNTRNILPGNYN